MNILMRVVPGAFKVAGYVVAALMAGLVTLNLVVPRLTGTVPLSVFTGSMSPTIPTGSLVLVRPIDPERLNEGDVITFESAPQSERYLTHRIIDVDTENGKRVFTTKGDANPRRDLDPVPEGAVRGKVAFHLPYAGRIGDRVRSPEVLAGILVLCGLGLLVSKVMDKRARRDCETGADTPVVELPSAAGPVPHAAPVLRQLLVVTVSAGGSDAGAVIHHAQALGGSLLALEPDRVTVLLAAAPDVVDRLVQALGRWTIESEQRSDVLAVGVHSPNGSAALPAGGGELHRPPLALTESTPAQRDGGVLIRPAWPRSG